MHIGRSGMKITTPAAERFSFFWFVRDFSSSLVLFFVGGGGEHISEVGELEGYMGKGGIHYVRGKGRSKR